MRLEIMINKEQKVSDATLYALKNELYLHLTPVFPKTSIRIWKGSANGLALNGVGLDEDKKRVMQILQQVWEDDRWLH